MPPPLPATGSALGKSTVSVEGELYGREPVGLGVRVPAIVVSPWSRGGYVNSEVFDHTSVIRFLENASRCDGAEYQPLAAPRCAAT